MRAAFVTELVVQTYSPYQWLLFQPLVYRTLVFGTPKDIIVPAPFQTDLASIPRIVRSLIPQNGRHRRAAVVHDYLYRLANIHGYSRGEADAIFLEAMLVDGVPKYRAYIMYTAVRAGGWFTWNKAMRRNHD